MVAGRSSQRASGVDYSRQYQNCRVAADDGPLHAGSREFEVPHPDRKWSASSAGRRAAGNSTIRRLALTRRPTHSLIPVGKTAFGWVGVGSVHGNGGHSF